MKNQSVENNLIGSIDRVVAGVASGWVYDQNSDIPLLVEIVADGVCLGRGLASNYRDDLKAAGIGDGYHAFNICLVEVDYSVCNSITFQAVEVIKKTKIPGASINFDLSPRFWSGEIRSEVQGYLEFGISSSEPVGRQFFVLFYDDQYIDQIAVDVSESELILHFLLPAHLRDGNKRLFKLGINGVPQLIASGYITPSLHVVSNTKDIVPLWLKTQRLDSLGVHLNFISQSDLSTEESAKKIHQAYEVLIGAMKMDGCLLLPQINLPKPQEPLVSIVILADKNVNRIYRCIASIAMAFNQANYEVILVGGAEDLKLSARIGNIQVCKVDNYTEVSPSDCYNFASTQAKGKYLIFAKSNHEVSSLWIDELLCLFKTHGNVGLVGSKLLHSSGAIYSTESVLWKDASVSEVGYGCHPLTPELNYTREVEGFVNGVICLTKNAFEAVGGFTSEYQGMSIHQMDLALKLRKVNYKVVFAPGSEVVSLPVDSSSSFVISLDKIDQSIFRRVWLDHLIELPSYENVLCSKPFDQLDKERILFIDYAMPRLNQDAGSYAAIQEMKLVQSLGFRVTFVAANMVYIGKYVSELQKIGVEVLHRPFYNSVNDVLEQQLTSFAAIYITRYNVAREYIDYIRQHSIAKVLFNNADLHFLRETRIALSQGGDDALLAQVLETRHAELDVCRKADVVLCYSSVEHAVIMSHIMEAEKLRLTPWVLEKKDKGVNFHEREGIAFLGGFDHFPNREAVTYLVDHVMPILKINEPEIVLYIYGSNIPEEFKECHYSNINVMGYAESLDDVYQQHRIFVAPLLSGAGIKGKVLDAIAYNLPCVLSTIAAEGTGLSHGVSALIADDNSECVSAITRLYRDQGLWEIFAQNSQMLFDAKYTKGHGEKVFREIFTSIGLEC